jgi:hypothetical protein
MEWQYRIREQFPVVREIEFLDQQTVLEFKLRVRNDETGCQTELEGMAKLRGEEGDLESREDESGHSHFVKEFEYATDQVRLIFALDLWEAELVWIYEADARLHQSGCSFGGDGPLMPLVAG